MRKDGELYEAVIAFVMGRRQADISDVVAALGDRISASVAVRELLSWAGRRKMKCIMRLGMSARVMQGKRMLVSHKLRKAVERGHLRRLERGVYGPPLPRVYAPEVRVS